MADTKKVRLRIVLCGLCVFAIFASKEVTNQPDALAQETHVRQARLLSARSPPPRSVGLGHVRLCQLRLHDGGHHRPVQRLLRRRGGPARAMGDPGMDGGPGLVLRPGGGDGTADRRLRRRARRQEEAAGHHHRRLHPVHGAARPGRAGNTGAGGRWHHRLQFLFRHRRESRRRLPARAGRHAAPWAASPAGAGASATWAGCRRWDCASPTSRRWKARAAPPPMPCRAAC